jgi:hypothetical protein
MKELPNKKILLDGHEKLRVLIPPGKSQAVTFKSANL